MKMMGSPNNSNIRAFSPNVASRQYALLEKRPPSVSVDAGGGGGAKGVTEKVRSFVTFFIRKASTKKARGRLYQLIFIGAVDPQEQF